MRLRLLRWGLLGSSVLAAAVLLMSCASSSDDAAGTPTTDVPNTDVATSGATASTDGTPTTLPGATADLGEDIALPAGVVWSRTDQVASIPGASATSFVFANSQGFAAFGSNEPAPEADLRLVGWFSSDLGRSWAVAAVDEVLSDFLPVAVAERDGLIVAVGGTGDVCFRSDDFPLERCIELAAAAIWSDDGGASWHPSTARLGPVGTMVSSVTATPSGFLAAGRDQGDGRDWQIVVWTSADGKSWSEAKRFRDPQWPLYLARIVSVGDTVVLSSAQAYCSEPFANGAEWVLKSPFFRQSQAWATTPDAAAWTELDLGALGLIEPVPGDFDCDKYRAYELDAPNSEGRFGRTGGPYSWFSSTGRWESLDATTWARLGDPVNVPGRHFIDTPSGLVGIQFRPFGSALIVNAHTSSDLLTWQDVSHLSPALPPVTGPGHQDEGWVDEVATSGDVAVAVGIERRDDGTIQPTFYRSEPTTVHVPALGECVPKAGLECPHGDFEDADLSGANLSGANLAGANFDHAILTGADLTGADLTGADLSYSDLSDADLTGATMQRADLGHAILDGADFTDADLSDAHDVEPVANAIWLGASLRGVRVSEYGEAGSWDLSGIDFSGGSVSSLQSGLSFAGSTLRGATLRGSFVDADFSEADLTDASFGSADLTGAKFAGATWGDNTAWYVDYCPDGFEPDLTGFPPVDCTGHFIDR